MATLTKPKKPHIPTTTKKTKLLSLLSLLITLTFLSLHFSSSSSTTSTSSNPWSGDLRLAQFPWNRLPFPDRSPPPATLKIAVFSRKWPVAASAPGGMERHARTLHSALSRRGHRVHVYTSAPHEPPSPGDPLVHVIDAPPGKWRPNDAWALFEAEHHRQPFDAIHSESVALPHALARRARNLAVTWHGVALESLHSRIEPISDAFNRTLSASMHKVLDEIRFFRSYAHHVAISDSAGEMLRDVYQIPPSRVHIILNGVDEREFGPDAGLGRAFRSEHGVPENARLVMGVAGRLVKDKGHPLLYEAFARVARSREGVYLVVVGAGPWARRYEELGPRVRTIGALPPSKLKGFYNALDVFVNPTLRPQGLDLTLMEAMRCGKPVMATKFPSIRGSVIVEAEFGFMFTPNVEAMVEAIEAAAAEGPQRLAERGRACGEYAREMFGARRMAMAYERLFLCIKDEMYCGYPSKFDY
ncbi:hypothetical protein QJS04_geneDACA011024 [Acorus gramineus]|uniref:Uncharacterized protein n=1 Tax=Acorus gramineus TaxID=55184 RepID=A0AAV9BGI9_ACOGR|nr:hypothetical protein QJS04_geneDACA011024 [Acorus gramineus]